LRRGKHRKASTAASLPPEGAQELVERVVPRLPKRAQGEAWHPQTIAWWKDIWKSPMSSEYVESDTHGLLRLAVLVDEFWWEPSGNKHKEVRLASLQYGQDPLSRRRLQWEVRKVEDAERRRPQAAKQGKAADDPRQVLRRIK
jgi:hypothetical protein